MNDKTQPYVDAYEYLPEVMPLSFFREKNNNTNGWYQVSKPCSNCNSTFWAMAKTGYLYLSAGAAYAYVKTHNFDCENCGCDTIHFYTYKREDVK